MPLRSGFTVLGTFVVNKRDLNCTKLPWWIFSEPVTVELELRNPLQIALQLSQVHLLWSFLPSDREDLISNDRADAQASDVPLLGLASLTCTWHSGQHCTLSFEQDGQAATLINTGMLDEVLLESEQKQRVSRCNCFLGALLRRIFPLE